MQILKIRTCMLAILLMFAGCRPKGELISVKVVAVTDLHAAVFPTDYVNNVPQSGSLAHIMSYVNGLRAQEGQHVILLDNGDLLQGQPAGYYFNLVSQQQPLLFADMMNYVGFDAASVGNHDIEMGPEVYTRLQDEFGFPFLAANVLDGPGGAPFFQPYTIIERGGIRLAVLGLTTPSIPNWLPRKLWDGLVFEDMYQTARYWMDHILTHETPDFVIGLFHSGAGPEGDNVGYNAENAAWYVARNVPGFDVVFSGHDHQVRNSIVKNTDGKDVVLIAGQSHGRSVAQVDLVFSKNQEGKVSLRSKNAAIVSMESIEPDPGFMSRYSEQAAALEEFVSQPLGRLAGDLVSRDAYTGNSAFVDLIHHIQFAMTDAQVSFAAPLSFNALLKAGEISMREMFRLYPFENYLYVMELTGQEIKNFLEFSKALWFNTISSANDHIFNFRKDASGALAMENGRARFAGPFFNFDSAAGIDYTVDLTKPAGSRVEIKGFSNGQAFLPQRTYRVAINSYRGSGGGGHLTTGAGILPDNLENRIVWVSENDIRNHIAAYIRNADLLDPQAGSNWKLVPEDLVNERKIRDLKLLFGN